MQPDFKIELFIDKRPNGILNASTGTLSTKNANDFYVNVPLRRDITLFEDYVTVTLDPFRTEIKRQLINPYFIELGFFENIKTISASTISESQFSVTEKVKSYGITINK